MRGGGLNAHLKSKLARPDDFTVEDRKLLAMALTVLSNIEFEVRKARRGAGRLSCYVTLDA